MAAVGQLYDALLEDLYSQSDWPQLGQALADDAAGNGGTGRRPVESLQHGRLEQRRRRRHRHRLPRPSRLARPGSYGALADCSRRPAPVFGPLLAWGEAGCAVWPVPPTRTVGPVAAPGAPPILVMGTTNDPATPYAWAVSVAKELDHGVLLTHDGDDHVAYFYSACVRQTSRPTSSADKRLRRARCAPRSCRVRR